MRNYCLRNKRRELAVFVRHSHSFCSFSFIELSSFRRFYLTEGMDGGLDLQTETGVIVGQCDVFGQMDLSDFQPCQRHFSQLWVQPKYARGKSPKCIALLVKLFPFPTASAKGRDHANSGQTSVSACPSHLSAIVQTTLRNIPFPKDMEGTSSVLLIDCQFSKNLETFLAHRLGIGWAEIDEWISVKPRDALVLLG
jgi:hypothetical protein